MLVVYKFQLDFVPQNLGGHNYWILLIIHYWKSRLAGLTEINANYSNVLLKPLNVLKIT